MGSLITVRKHALKTTNTRASQQANVLQPEEYPRLRIIWKLFLSVSKNAEVKVKDMSTFFKKKKQTRPHGVIFNSFHFSGLTWISPEDREFIVRILILLQN